MVLLATAATVIASQAVITGAFSVAAQAAQLGYLPRLRVAHTSESTIGQIYVPWINWMLMVAVLTLVFAFRSSAALAYAFGMAVITHDHHHHAAVPLPRPGPLADARCGWSSSAAASLLLVDLLFLAANLTKLVHGAWLPLLIGLIAFAVMTTWQRGRAVVTRERERAEGSLRAFVDELHESRPPLLEVPGTAIFLNRGKDSAPLAMRANVEHNRVRHEHVVILVDRDATGAPGAGRASGSRSTISAGPATGSSTSARTSATWRRRTCRARSRLLDPAADRGPDRRSTTRVLLPLEDRADEGHRTDDGALAQAAVHRDVLHHGRRRRVLRPAARPLGDHGVADRGVTVPCARAAAACSASVTATWRRSRSGRRTAFVDVSR